MKAADRDALVKWLTSERVAENYDNPDRGDLNPADIISRNCLSCHSRKADIAKAGAAKQIPLDYWTDLKDRAISRRVAPTDRKVLVASTHAHALSLATLTIVLAGLTLMTSWPRALLGLLIGVMGLALLADIGGWWLAPNADAVVYVIIGAGAAYNGSVVIACFLVLADLALPSPRAD